MEPTPKPCLCVHGHFYQPPRENPWMEAIEYQESAAPFHDWNDRIHFECYLPNAKARVLDAEGRVTNIVNNFEKISYNFGPTLLSWLESEHPETYRMVLEADKKSCALHAGHGNAIAQVYNHMILPLANRRDKQTQVRWGIDYFRRHFGRDPESIWLAETACNEETLEVLVEENMRYLILSPTQAEAARDLDQEEWQDVSDGRIDPRQPYRCFLRGDPEKFIDVFFYDGPISKSLGFDDILFDAARFADRIENAVDRGRSAPQLIHVSTDGETYGHHKAYGDRVLAYVLDVEAPRRGFRVANYGTYLSENPPRRAVRIKRGTNDEGTSWSCAHGVERWKSDCGCRTGGPEWNQKWRRPLRDALDYLRDALAPFYEHAAGRFLGDPWRARDRYIDVILDRSQPSVDRFFERHALRPLEKAEKVLCLKLLEMQRHAMLMYTSCGWFFNELSGIETVQVLQYAARALQLADEAAPAGYDFKAVQSEFLERLAAAKSNLPGFGDGRGVYRRFVEPAVISAERLAAHYGLSAYFEELREDFVSGFKVAVLEDRSESQGALSLRLSRIRIVSDITAEETEWVYVVLRFGAFEFRCSVKPSVEFGDFKQAGDALAEAVSGQSIVDLAKAIDAFFGQKMYSLKDLFVDQRRKVVAALTREAIDKVGAAYEAIHDEYIGIQELYQSIRLPVPEAIHFATQYGANRRLLAALDQLAQARFNGEKLKGFVRQVEAARKTGVQVRKPEFSRKLCAELERRTAALAVALETDRIAECLNIQKAAEALDADLDVSAAQDHVFELLKTLDFSSFSSLKEIAELAKFLRINPAEFPYMKQPENGAGREPVPA